MNYLMRAIVAGAVMTFAIPSEAPAQSFGVSYSSYPSYHYGYSPRYYTGSYNYSPSYRYRYRSHYPYKYHYPYRSRHHGYIGIHPRWHPGYGYVYW